jgi:hypothetical protein
MQVHSYYFPLCHEKMYLTWFIFYDDGKMVKGTEVREEDLEIGGCGSV